jgi:hypothetical protein
MICSLFDLQSDLHGLIKVQHVDYCCLAFCTQEHSTSSFTILIPAPISGTRRVGIGIDLARAMFREQPMHRRTTRTAIQPDGKRSILGIIASLKEPEELAAALANTSSI